MRNLFLLVALLLFTVEASAQGRRVVAVTSCGHAAPVQQYYQAPVQQYTAPYVAPYVAPVVYPTVQTYQPIAVYVVPGTPTASLTVYPGQLSVIQPVPVQITVNMTTPTAPPVAPAAPAAPAAPVTVPLAVPPPEPPLAK